MALAVLLAVFAAFAASPPACAAKSFRSLAALDSLDARLARADYAAAESLGLALLLTGGPGGRAPSPRDSADVAERVMFAARRNYHEGRPAIRALAERALAIREAERPADSLRIAAALEGLAYARSGAGDRAGARALGERVLAIRSARLPAEHPDVARALHNLGTFAYAQGRFAEGLEFFRRAAEARIRAWGEANAEVAYSLNGEAACAYVLDRRELSDSLQRRILAIRERILPAGHPDRVKSLSAVALSAQALGDLSEAERFARRAVEAAEAYLPEEHVERTYADQRLAEVLREQGDYAASRTLNERVVASFTRHFGPYSNETLTALHALLLTLVRAGDYGEAERVARAQLDGLRRGHPTARDVGSALDDLAWAQFRQAQFDSALVNEREALALVTEALGPANSLAISVLTNLAAMEAGAGHYAVADSLYGRSIEAKTAKHGPASMQLANALEGQGAVREARGDLAGATDSYQRARAITEAGRPADDPLVGLALASVARISFLTGQRDTALTFALRAERIGREHFRTMAGALSEREALRYAATRVSALALALTLATDAKGVAPGKRFEIWDSVLRSRGLVLDAMIERRALTAQGDAETARLAADLALARSRRARAAIAAADSEGFAALERLRGEVDRAERALAQQSAGFRHRRQDAGAGLAEIASALPPGSALLAYVRYERGVIPGAAIREHAQGAPAYAAFVLRAGEQSVSVVPLGGAAALESAVGAWTRALATPPPADAAGARAAESECRKLGNAVRRAAWDPVAPALGAAQLVLVVPDGALHTAPLAALPEGRSGYLLEQGFTLHVLTSERDVLPRPAPPEGRGLLAMGGADFDRADSSRATPDLVAMASGPEASYRGSRSGCEAFARLRFGPLPGSGAEVAAISKTWEEARPQDAANDEVATGARASEALFKRSAAGHRIAHLATHGFFVDVGCALDSGSGSRGVLGLVPAAGSTAPVAAPPGENPLLLSGLALAGANLRAGAPAGAEDGVLTSDEIAALDLSGMEWAVLSACGTGLGELAGPEGVLGLRRAFLAAGAGTVFTSLWSVRDQPAREWMEALYRHRFAEGAGTAESAKLAALDLLRARRTSKAATHPFEWAAFLAVGDWR